MAKAKSNLEEKKFKPASENEAWRFTCLNIGKDEKEMAVGKNNIDFNNSRFLEELGFSKNTNGGLTIKAYDNIVEKETIKGKKVVQKRLDKDGNTLYENSEARIDREESR